jgi:opacity protein-like surface antigen
VSAVRITPIAPASSLRRARGGGPADVDTYSLTYLHPRPRPRIARFMLGLGGGTGMYTAGTDARDLGAMWYGSIGLEVARVLTIEGRYQGAHNGVPVSIDQNGGYGVLANGVTGLVRLALPTPYVSPYVQSGIGFLWFAPTGSAQGQQSVVPDGLTNVPVGGGVEFRFTRSVGLDLEYNYQFLLDSRWTFDHASHPWGDLWNANAALRFYL